MKLLVIAQGVTKKDDYVLEDLIDFLSISKQGFVYKTDKHGNTWIMCPDKSNYDVILIVNTERYLVNYSWLGIWDRLGDYIVGILFGKAKLARKAIVEAINDLLEQYPNINIIDGFGHSFGALLLAGLKIKFNKLVLAGCPTSASKWLGPVSKQCKNNIGIFNEYALHIFYLWNKKDPFCNKPLATKMVLYPWQLNNIECARGHTFYNPKKKLEDCYLPHVDEILKIKKELQ